MAAGFAIRIASLLLLMTAATAAAQDQTMPETKALSGMSVLGNNEAPKSLVIVPWKTSQLGDGIGIDQLLDGGVQPVDRDVFDRQLDYYELRVGWAEIRPQPAGEPQRMGAAASGTQ